eukprot:m.394083 g.394083  ORF g.394083 m.394083 type:complete len:302 (-) comp20095_c2_seq2:80-985(-)
MSKVLPPTEGEEWAVAVAWVQQVLGRVTWHPSTNAGALDLASLALTSMPPEIGQLAELSGIILSDNRLTSVPPELGQLAALARLYLDGNRLTSLPHEIGQLTALFKLHLKNNRLASLPAELAQIKRLNTLSLDDRGMPGVPFRFGGYDRWMAAFLFFCVVCLRLWSCQGGLVGLIFTVAIPCLFYFGERLNARDSSLPAALALIQRLDTLALDEYGQYGIFGVPRRDSVRALFGFWLGFWWTDFSFWLNQRDQRVIVFVVYLITASLCKGLGQQFGRLICRMISSASTWNNPVCLFLLEDR